MAAQSFDRSNRSNLDSSVSLGEAKAQEPPKESRRVISDSDRTTVHALHTAESKSCDGDAQVQKGLKSTGQDTKSCSTVGVHNEGIHDLQHSGCAKADVTNNDSVHSTREVAGDLPAHKEIGKGEEKTDDRMKEEPKPGSAQDPEDMKVRLQILLHILETSQDAEEKKATLQQISCLAEAMKDIIRIELEEDDGDSSDSHSTASSPEPLLDIPLPNQPFSRSKKSSDADLTGIPLPGSSPVKRLPSTRFFDEDSSEVPPLPPLPPESSGKKESGKGKKRDGSGDIEGVRSSKVDGTERCLEFLREDTEDGALQTNTSLGLITLHVNKKLVPRLSRASVFDLNDENAKEIGRKLLRLKKLKKLRKMEEVSEHKIEAKERISMWKEELLGNGGLSIQPSVIPTVLPGSLPEKEAEEPRLERVDAVAPNATLVGPVPTSKVETPSKDDVISKSGANKVIKTPKKPNQKPLTFVKVQSKDDKKEFDWPVEMILSTKLSPKICYSCNPLEFNFDLSNARENAGKPAEEEAKSKERKKKKGESAKKENSHSEETQKKEDGRKTGSGGVDKKVASETGALDPSRVAQQSKGREESKNGQKRKSGQSSDPKKKSKEGSKGHDALTTQKGKGTGTDSRDAKKTPTSKDSAKGGKASEEGSKKESKIDADQQRTREKDSAKDGGRKRKLSACESKQPTRKKTKVVSKSVELAPIGSGRVSDFEDVAVGTGAGKWDTSSDSERDLPGLSKPTANRASTKVDTGRKHDKRRSRVSSERDTSSSRDRHSDDDSDSQRSRSSRSYSSRSYYSSDRSYSSDSDYRRRRSRSSTRSRRRSSSSYSNRSYRSKSRSYARSRRSRSRSGSRDRFRSYSTYSRSSRSYSRSRSRSKSRSYRRYSRSFDKRSYDRRLGRGETRARPSRQERKQETRSKGDTHNTKNRRSVENLSSTTRLSSLSKPKEVSDADASGKAETTASKTDDKSKKSESDENIGKVGETPKSEVGDNKSDGKDALSIPLPSSSKENGEQPVDSIDSSSIPNDLAFTFIGPTLPVNHPLVHVQDIPVPKNEQFQPIGPNDPLVFKKPLLPPPPPPSFLTDPGSKVVGNEPPLPPKPRSPPPLPNDWSTMEDIYGDEDPIPHMLDMGAMKPAMIIPPEQADQYRALQQQAQQHARQRMRQEAGIDEEEEEEEPPMDEAQLQQQMIDEMMLEQAQQNATFLAAASAQPMIHIPQQQLLASGLASAQGHQVVVGGSGFFQMPMTMQMMSTGHPHGLVTLAPSMGTIVHPQTGAPMVIAAQQSGAMSALIRAHEAQAQAQAQAEAAEEAEAQAKAAAQASILQAQAQPHHEWVQIVQMPGSNRAFAIPAGGSMQHAFALSGLRSSPSAALHQVHPHHGMIPIHAVNHPSLHHHQQPTLVQSLPFGFQMRVGMSPSVGHAPQVLSSAGQPQGMPLLIDSSGNILVPRLLR